MSFGHLELQNLSTGGLGAGAGGLRLGGDFFVTDTPTDARTDRHMETFSFYIDTAK